MKVVVITGGIGSGKSMACCYLNRRYGWPVYEADARVKELYSCHPTLLSDIENALAAELRNEDGSLNPQALSDIIFQDAEALTKVESFVFPALLDDFDNWKASHADNMYVILESATILEKPQLKGIGDCVLLIDAPVEIRLSRAACRDGASEEKILLRMARQKMMNDISSGAVQAPADQIILNDGTVGNLEEKLDGFVKSTL